MNQDLTKTSGGEVPPPPPTTDIRTFQSDLEMISETGGLSMQAKEVSEMLAHKEAASPSVRPAGRGSGAFFRILGMAFVIVIITVVLGFFLYLTLSPVLPSLQGFWKPAAPAPSSTPSSYTPASSTVAQFDPYADIESVRFFRLEADASFDLPLSREAIASSDDLLTFHQRLEGELRQIPAKAKFIEVMPKKSGDRPADFLTFRSLTGVTLFDEKVLSEHFYPNFSLFVHRDGKGEWPGYVFRLNAGENPLVLRDQLRMIERSGQLGSLFLKPVPLQPLTFSDAVVAETPVRLARVKENGGTIVYGWFGERFLVLGTSEAGLVAAFNHLVR